MKSTEFLTELRGLPVDELKTRVTELEEQVFRLRIQRAIGQSEAGHKMRPLRRKLARVKTVLREKSENA